ncbi:MAG: hypothetical protein AAGE43_00920 [Pseudomonadota bacterium]
MMLRDYLDRTSARLKARLVARGAAAIGIALVVLTGTIAYALVTLVPAGGWVVSARLALYSALAVALIGLVRFVFNRRRSADTLEALVPAFAGRLRTWFDADERGDASPMLTLLARDVSRVAEQSPPRRTLPARQLYLPAAVAAIAAVAFLWLLGAGPGSPSPLQLAALRLWTGELFTAAAPRIVVTPGDTVIPRGSDLVIEATASGFAPSAMALHAEFDGISGWETAPMARLGDGRYGFVFVGVNEAVSYYAGAAGISSERHVIRVADLPKVTDLVLEYRYPDWTELPARERREGDIAALAGTRIGITATTDAPLSEALIVVNGEVLDAEAEGRFARGAFEVVEAGNWHLAVRHEGTLARISDSYFIDVVADQPPELAFSWPGHDVQATAIEERTLRFAASDDFGVRSLTLHYAINGGPWESAELSLPGAAPDAAETADAASSQPAGSQPTGFKPTDTTSEHTLELETLRVMAPLPDAPARPLRAGDLISFYAQAQDHAQEARTSLYFIDVRPFDRSYRESQTMAGQGGQGGGGADELVQRQREIVTATWNLRNRLSRGEGEPGDEDQAEVLALLQRTLADQVTTLIERAAARRLTVDEEIDTFSRELTSATEDMIPAAEELEAQALEAAIAPAQQALQHLLAAQATVNDVDVSMGSSDMRGTTGRSLSELMDLEMDQERNRYETPQNPTGGNAPEPESEEWQQLKELADRQEALARQQSLGEESLASRWQQERLQRELERLQEELERRQRQAQQQSLSRQSQGSGGASSSSEALDNAISELNRARQSISESLAREQSDPAASRAATEAIRRASEQLRDEAVGNLNERLARSERSVQNLLADQRNIMDRLDEVQDDALEARDGIERRFDDYAMEAYADRKRRMQDDLNDLTRELGALGRAMEDGDTAAVLAEANRELAEERLDERLAASADAFEFGRPLYAIGNEAAVERALERLAGRLAQARRMLASSDGQSSENSTLAEVRELRAQLAEMTGGNGSASPPGGSQPGALGGAVPNSNSGGGAFDQSALSQNAASRNEMEALLRRADALEYRLGQELGEEFRFDTRYSREAYSERGTNAANTQVLAELMSDRLDLMEAALTNRGTLPIRAQEPRDEGRDSDAAARYFETLSQP